MMNSARDNLRDIFEVIDTALAQATPDVLGIWATIPAPATAGVTFDTTIETDAFVPCWQAHLPVDMDEANWYMLTSERKLVQSEHALLIATDRLATIAQQDVSQQAFNISSATTSAADAVLFHLLQALQEPASGFLLGDRLNDEWQQIILQFQAFMERLQNIVAHYAWVETYIEGQLLAKTSVSWTGDVTTAWQAGLIHRQKALHQRTLVLALASRKLLTRIFVLVVRSSVAINVGMATPTGPLLVAPALWKFINLVLEECSVYQQNRIGHASDVESTGREGA